MDRAGNDKSQEWVGLGLIVFFFSSFALKIIGKEIERKREGTIMYRCKLFGISINFISMYMVHVHA